MMYRRGIILLIVMAAAVSAGARTGVVDSLLRAIDSGSGAPPEGVWQMAGTPESQIAICRSAGMPGRYDVWLIDSPDYSLEPGILIGSATAGAKRSDFDLELVDKPGSLRPKRHYFIASLDDDGNTLRLRAYHKKMRISLWRWIPYLFRVTVIKENTRPDDHEGFVRIYPQGGGATAL